MKLMVSAMCILLLLTACTSPKTLEPTQPEPDAATATSQPTSSDATTSSGSLESKDTIAAQPAIHLVTLGGENDGLWGRLVDPQSLNDLPGYPSISFGHHYTYAVSADEEVMALITWPNGMGRGGVLHLIELATWKDHTTNVKFDSYVSSLLFSADGKRLYWNEPTRIDPAHGLPRDYILYRYDLDSELRTEVLQLPPSFEPWEMQLLNTGSRLAIYGLFTTPENLADDFPHVLIVDLEAKRIAFDVRIEGVTAFQMRVETAGADENPYQMYRPGLAWDLVRSLLYVVHADSDRLTVVDLEQGEVRQQADIRPAQSLLEHILGWRATPAKAKDVPGTEKWARLDAEGKRLFVVGSRLELEKKPDSQEWVRRQIPLDLQIIDTENLTMQLRSDLPATNLALSPDGKWLLLTSAYDSTGADGKLERVANGLYLVNAQTLQISGHLLEESDVTLHGFSADGRYGFVSTASSEWMGDHWGNWNIQVHLLELESGHFATEREFPGYFLDIIPSWGR